MDAQFPTGWLMMTNDMIYQCRLSDGEWTTVGWVEDGKAKVGTKMKVVQRWFDGTTTKPIAKIRDFTIVAVYDPPQPEAKPQAM
jgi:hypothetical protein